MSPFLIPGTEVSEKLNSLHGFLNPRTNEDVEVVDKKKKMENVDANRLPFLSSNLIIEPHPEEYLANRIRKAAAKLDQKITKQKNVFL